MEAVQYFFVVSLVVQLLHCVEELMAGFHKRWYLFTMPFWVFFVFEVIFESFWIAVWLWEGFPNRSGLQLFFLMLMFANGVQHLVWAGSEKRYVPGLITAPLHIVVFSLFYFSVL